MIRLPPVIYLASAPVNLRLSFDRLGGIVRDVLGHEPRTEAAFVFHNKARTHVKILWHDGRGYCVLFKRLDRGTFRIQRIITDLIRNPSLSSATELGALFEGIDASMLRRARQIVNESRATD